MKYCTVCKAKYEDDVSFCPLDGEVLEADPSSIVNTVLDGQYQIESMLGKGGMGAVYKARHILLGDRVAIKVLPPEVRNNAEWLRRFRREGQAARRFRHPNSVTVYDLRTSGDGTIYMVMEYVEGHTLDAEIKRRGRFTPAEAFAVLEPIISVLNTAHEMGVVHRDLKPENIMIGNPATGGEPVVKLLDLGIAKMREIAGADSGGTTALTMAGQVLGTPYYMSPEQWGELPEDGNPEIDGRADIYSLGLVFYEMIVGQRPHRGLTLQELRREHVNVTPRPLHEVVSDAPLAFSAAISRAIAKDRGQRQLTAGELGAELRAALSTGLPPGDPGRTLPDLPFVGSSSAHTVGIAGALETKSDVNAPTILTVDSPPVGGPSLPSGRPTSAPVVAAPATAGPAKEPQPVVAASTTAPTVAAIAPSLPVPTPSEVERAPQPVRRGSFALLGAGAVVLALVVLGVGGFLALSWLRAKPDEGTKGTSAVDNKGANNPVKEGATTFKELGRYWLELLPAGGGESTRVAGVVPLASGQSFKFHFWFEENGNLYIIGPGNQNQTTAFLTSKPAAMSGVNTNQVVKGTDYSFPGGSEHWLELDKKPGTEDYTIVFSPTPLSYPGFLENEVTSQPLTADDQTELTAFFNKYKTNDPVTEVNDKSVSEPFVLVKLPKTVVSSNPIIFQIRIQHK